MKQRHTICRLLAVLAWLGLVLAPIAGPANAMASTEMTATVEPASMDMPDGMPCCPETQKKPDCAKDCPFMALCAVKLLSGIANGPGIAAPFPVSTRVAPTSAAKLSGLAHAPPPRPPNA